MNQMAIVAVVAYGVSAMLWLYFRTVMAVETLLIGRRIQKKRFLGVMGGMTGTATLFDRLVAYFKVKRGSVMAVETELRAFAVEQKRVCAVVWLMAFQALPLGDRLVNHGCLWIGGHVAMAGEAQIVFICLQVGLADQTVIAVTVLT